MPTIYVLSKNKKNVTIFHLKIIIFTAMNILKYIAWTCFCNDVLHTKQLYFIITKTNFILSYLLINQNRRKRKSIEIHMPSIKQINPVLSWRYCVPLLSPFNPYEIWHRHLYLINIHCNYNNLLSHMLVSGLQTLKHWYANFFHQELAPYLVWGLGPPSGPFQA